MSKKEFCLNNEAVAVHDYYKLQIHGIEYGINDYIYLSRLYQKNYCGEKYVKFHKVKIYSDIEGRQYFKLWMGNFDGSRSVHTFYIDEFIKIGVWQVSYITCKELKEIA